MFLIDLFEDANHITFCFGRMNPPTVGHKAVFDTMAQQGGDMQIFVSQTQDPKKNPLSYKQKIDFIRKIHSKYAKNVVENSALNTPWKVAAYLYNQGYRSATFVGGDDRQEMYEDLKKYNGVKGAHGFYKFEPFDFVSSGAREDGSAGLAGISATAARKDAASGDLSSFTKHTGAGQYAKEMFAAVRQGMGIVEEDAAGVGVIAKNKKMASDPRYSTSITQDVKFNTMNKNLDAFNLKENQLENKVLMRLTADFDKFVPLKIKEKIYDILENGPSIEFVRAHNAYLVPRHLFYKMQDTRELAPYIETVTTTKSAFREGITDFNNDDPMNSRVAPAGGVGSMPLRDWKIFLRKRVNELNKELATAVDPALIDKKYIWDHIKELLAPDSTITNSVRAIIDAHNELARQRQRGGVMSQKITKD